MAQGLAAGAWAVPGGIYASTDTYNPIDFGLPIEYAARASAGFLDAPPPSALRSACAYVARAVVTLQKNGHPLFHRKGRAEDNTLHFAKEFMNMPQLLDAVDAPASVREILTQV